MRHRRRVAFLFAILLALPAAFASAATVQDLIKLKAAGLSDEILISLIQSDGSVFHLNADDVIAVRKEGLSEKVIMAMLATAIKPVTVAPKPVPAPISRTTAEAPPTPLVQVNDPSGQQTYYGDARESNAQEPDDSRSQKTAPVVINVTQKVEQHVEDPRSRNNYADMYYPPGYNPYLPLYTTYPVFVARPGIPVAPAAPVYWGFNGQRRPDTWRSK